MSAKYLPPTQPPYGPPAPPGQPPRRTAGHPLGWIAMAALLVITGISAAVAWGQAGSSHTSAQLPGGPSGSYHQGGYGSLPKAGGSPGSSYAIPSYSLPSYTVPTYTPPAIPTPSYLLDPTAVSRTLDGFMNAMTYHDLATVKTLVCPKYRADYVGTYFNGEEIARWDRSAFTIPADQNWIAIYVAISLRNPNTGASAGTYNHSWIVEKDDNTYYVCGYQV